MVDTQPLRCLNCDTPLQGKFCHNCGQKQVEPSERTLKYFVFQFFGSAFFLENNFLKNLWAVAVKPGVQTLDYIEGRRKRWMPAFSVFLLINLIYFLSNPPTDLNLSLMDQMRQPHHGAIANSMVTSKIEKENISLEEYAKKYGAQSLGLTKTLIILNVPILAAFLMLLYGRKPFYYADHFIYSLYLFAFTLLLTIMMDMLGYLLSLARINATVALPIMGVTAFGGMVVYVLMSIRKVYREGWLVTIGKSILVMVFFVATHFLYRSLLFFVTFWTT